MNAGQIVWNQPHLMSKILYEFGGCITLSAIAFNEDYKDFSFKDKYAKCSPDTRNWFKEMFDKNKYIEISSKIGREYRLLYHSTVFLPAEEAEEECTWIRAPTSQWEFDLFQQRFNLKSNKRDEMYNELFPNMIKNVQISDEKKYKK